MVAATSWPWIFGNCGPWASMIWISPVRKWKSDPHRPMASGRSSASPGPGAAASNESFRRGEHVSQENSAPAPDDDAGYDYDVLVVGSGFGGSVSALRLTEKGYRVGVLEAGRRWTRESLPKNSWDLKNYLWAPRLGMYGIQRIHLLGNVMVLAGAGVGGLALAGLTVVRRFGREG